MMPFIMPSALCDADTDTNGCHMTKKAMLDIFHCLNQRNAVVPLMIPVVSCDANVSASGVT